MTVERKHSPSDINQLISRTGRGLWWKRIAMAFVFLAVSAGAAVAYQTVNSEKQDPASRFKTDVVKQGDLKSSISSTGTVDALNTVEVGAEISGTIQKIWVDFNDPVEKDQLLVELDPEQQDALVAEARARVLASKAEQARSKALHVEATQNQTRVKALADRSLASSKELESAVSSVATAKATLQAARANTALYRANYDSAVTALSKTEIKSPIDGMVLSREVEEGQSINAGMSTPVLFTLAEDLRKMELASLVDEADIGSVEVGQSARFTVDAYPGKTFLSEVRSVRNTPTIDSNVVSYEVILTVDNEELLLKPGMTATVEIITESLNDVLLVPNKALRFTPPRDQKRPRGPQMPLLGGKTPSKNQNSAKRDKGDSSTSLQANQGRLWVHNAGHLQPVIVTKLATDGTVTAVESPDLAAGTEVITGLAEASAEASKD